MVEELHYPVAFARSREEVELVKHKLGRGAKLLANKAFSFSSRRQSEMDDADTVGGAIYRNR